jgi:hypothetical protein
MHPLANAFNLPPTHSSVHPPNMHPPILPSPTNSSVRPTSPTSANPHRCWRYRPASSDVHVSLQRTLVQSQRAQRLEQPTHTHSRRLTSVHVTLGNADGLRGLPPDLLRTCVGVKERWLLVHAAARRGHAACIRALADCGAGATFFSKSDGGYTPASLAARYGHAECLHALADMGAIEALSVAVGENDVTPAHSAALKGHAACLMALGERGGCRYIHIFQQIWLHPCRTGVLQGSRRLPESARHFWRA